MNMTNNNMLFQTSATVTPVVWQKRGHEVHTKPSSHGPVPCPAPSELWGSHGLVPGVPPPRHPALSWPRSGPPSCLYPVSAQSSHRCVGRDHPWGWWPPWGGSSGHPAVRHHMQRDTTCSLHSLVLLSYSQCHLKICLASWCFYPSFHGEKAYNVGQG